MNKKVGILGTGSYVPENIVDNLYFEKILDTSDEWIKTRTGISKRRKARDNESASDLATKAAIKAIECANLTPQDIDLIIVATATPDMTFPSTACLVQENIKAKNAAAFDISAACSGFIYGITIAKQFVQTNMYKNVLVIGRPLKK